MGNNLQFDVSVALRGPPSEVQILTQSTRERNVVFAQSQIRAEPVQEDLLVGPEISMMLERADFEQLLERLDEVPPPSN